MLTAAGHCMRTFLRPPAGEYPVASTSANERAENTKHLKNRRGETVGETLLVL